MGEGELAGIPSAAVSLQILEVVSIVNSILRSLAQINNLGTFQSVAPVSRRDRNTITGGYGRACNRINVVDLIVLLAVLAIIGRIVGRVNIAELAIGSNADEAGGISYAGKAL